MHMFISPRGGEEPGDSKDFHFQNIQINKNSKIDSLYDSTAPEIRNTSKNLQIKVVQNSILYKKVTGCIRLSPTGVELEGFKDCYL